MKPDTSDTNYVYAEGKDALAAFGDSDEKVQVWIGDEWADRLSKSQAYCRGDFYRKPKHLVKQSFSIYEAPIRCSANEMEHRKAIMHAWVDGSVVEYENIWKGGWSTLANPKWEWAFFKYRIKKPTETPQPKIASGHNPDNLTEDQVGVKDGWRLLSKEEVSLNANGGSVCFDETQWWNDNRWSFTTTLFASETTNTLRTLKPAGCYLPKKKELKPWTFETAPKGCVLVRLKNCSNFGIATAWFDSGLYVSGVDKIRGWRYLANVCEHSLDSGATWLQCGTYE